MGHFCSCGHYMTSFPWHALLRRELHFLQINGSRSGAGGNRAGRGRGAAACRGGLRFGQDGSVRRASLRPCIPPSVRPSLRCAVRTEPRAAAAAPRSLRWRHPARQQSGSAAVPLAAMGGDSFTSPRKLKCCRFCGLCRLHQQ